MQPLIAMANSHDQYKAFHECPTLMTREDWLKTWKPYSWQQSDIRHEERLYSCSLAQGNFFVKMNSEGLSALNPIGWSHWYISVHRQGQSSKYWVGFELEGDAMFAALQYNNEAL